MKKNYFVLVVLISLFSCSDKKTPETGFPQSTEEHKPIPYFEVTYPSIDSLQISARVYEIDKNAPVIVLCHQARFNKFEYDGIAEELNAKGFNCIAIDQRSGGPIASQQNETMLRALKSEKSIDYLDAEQDIVASVNYAFNKYGRKVILWGSSYSSTLVLYVAAQSDQVKAVISFSPGNYFVEERGDLVSILDHFDKPMFLTSSKQEAPFVTELIANKNLNKYQVQFIPENEGHHGSRALWPNQLNGDEYWLAVDNFLKMITDEKK